MGRIVRVLTMVLSLSACQATADGDFGKRLTLVAEQLVQRIPETERVGVELNLRGPRSRWPVFRHRAGEDAWNALVDEYTRLRSVGEPGYGAMLGNAERRFRAPQ